MSAPFTLLDLYCGAGGAGAGYHRAGFEVTGVDIKGQPHYPYRFIQGDAVSFAREHGHEYDAIHASPPCHAFTPLRSLQGANYNPVNLIPETRAALIDSGRPYVIENVPGAPLKDYVRLCGSSFGLKVQRHRLFESNIALLAPPCHHVAQGQPIGVYGNGGDWSKKKWDQTRITNRKLSIRATRVADCRDAMGMDWGTRRGVTQAIPPAYTYHLGLQLIRFLENERGGR